MRAGVATGDRPGEPGTPGADRQDDRRQGAGREIPNVFAACGTQLRQVVVTAPGGMRCAICALAYSPYVGYVGDKGTKFQAQKAHCGHWNSSNRNERTLAHLDLLALASSSPVDSLKALAPVAL